MRVLVVGDTHKRDDVYRRLVHKLTDPIDLVLHTGDVEGSEWVYEQVPGCEARIVAGNNDYFSKLPPELEFTLGSTRVLLTHGHHYRVYLGTDMLEEEARARGVGLVIFGHTHMPMLRLCPGNLTLLNPGSLSYPRQDGRRPTYGIIDVDADGQCKCDILRV